MKKYSKANLEFLKYLTLKIMNRCILNKHAIVYQEFTKENNGNWRK